MGYHLKTSITTGPERTPPFQPVGPKTHTPLSPMQDRGLRFYNPAIGRWVNRDPIGERDEISLYVFINNKAINAVDYLGKYSLNNLGDISVNIATLSENVLSQGQSPRFDSGLSFSCACVSYPGAANIDQKKITCLLPPIHWTRFGVN